MNIHKWIKEYESEFVLGILVTEVAIFLLELWKYAL